MVRQQGEEGIWREGRKKGSKGVFVMHEGIRGKEVNERGSKGRCKERQKSEEGTVGREGEREGGEYLNGNLGIS